MDPDTEAPPQTTSLPIPDQWLLVGLLVLGAVLIETSVPSLLRVPLTVASFVTATPETWIPLLVMVLLMAGALVLEGSGRPEAHQRLAWALAGVTGVAGVVWFFRGGGLDWHATPDWTKEWTYYTALRESLSQGQLPWFLNEAFQGTDRFFANAETNVAPHVVLLAWLDVPRFVVLQAVALLVVGLTAAYRLARDLHLGPIASMTFLAIFLMNGHVIAHLETGHGQWVSYLALPCVLLFVHRAATGDMSPRTHAGLALGLALIEMVGGWHIFVWCVIFVSVFVAGDRSRWRFGAWVALLVAGLSALRILPAVMFYEPTDWEFVGSYQSLEVLVGAFIGEPRRVTDGLNWWEYNAFVGWVGFVVVLAGLTAPLSRTWRHSVAALWAPSVALLTLSTFNLYQWTLFRLPGFESERVASRLLIVGLLGFTLIGCVQLNRWLQRQSLSPARLAVLGLAGVLLAAQLVAHTNSRRPRPDRGIGPPGVDVVSARRPEMAYAASVASGAVVTLASLGIAIRMWRRRA